MVSQERGHNLVEVVLVASLATEEVTQVDFAPSDQNKLTKE